LTAPHHRRQLSRMKVHLTGGTGFIGSYVACELAAAGHDVVVLARNPDKVPALATVPGIRIVRAPMEDLDALRAAIVEPEAVVHVALCWGDTGPTMIENETLASVRLIELALERGAQRFLYTSSTAAAGYELPLIDEDQRRRPTDFYGATKGAVELFLRAYAKKVPGRHLTVIRPGYTFGDPVVAGGSSETDGRFRAICGNARAGREIRVTRHDGTQFIWAGDLAKLYRAVVESELNDEIFYGLGRTFISWEQIARWAIEGAASSSELLVEDKGWSPDPVLFSVEKMKQHFDLSFDATEHVKRHITTLLAAPAA
jgi:UDP-glucose 4-epimerase